MAWELLNHAKMLKDCTFIQVDGFDIMKDGVKIAL